MNQMHQAEILCPLLLQGSQSLPNQLVSVYYRQRRTDGALTPSNTVAHDRDSTQEIQCPMQDQTKVFSLGKTTRTNPH